MDQKDSIDLKILKAIFGIARSIGSELELEKVCDLIVEKVFKVINCNGCVIILIDEGGSSCRARLDLAKVLERWSLEKKCP